MTATFTSITIEATCKNCGGPLELLAKGRPQDGGAVVNTAVRCVKNGCNRSWLIRHSMYSLSGQELDS